MANFSITYQDEDILVFIHEAKPRTVASWALDCAYRVLPLYEEIGQDDRPRQALEVGKRWIEGKAGLPEVHEVSLASQNAAIETDDLVLRAVAKCCSHAAATAESKAHALYAANYAIQAIELSGHSHDLMRQERLWQLERLPKSSSQQDRKE